MPRPRRVKHGDIVSNTTSFTFPACPVPMLEAVERYAIAENTSMEHWIYQTILARLALQYMEEPMPGWEPEQFKTAHRSMFVRTQATDKVTTAKAQASPKARPQMVKGSQEAKDHMARMRANRWNKFKADKAAQYGGQ